VELGSQDEEIAAHLRATQRKRVELFESAIRRAQTVGEVDATRDARSLAEFFAMTSQGLRVLIKTRPDEASLKRAVEVAMELLR